MIPLRENEKIIRIVRRHWWQGGKAFVAPILLVALFVILLYRLHLNFFGWSWQVLAVAVAAAGIISAAGMYRWRRNALIVTNQRLVRHEQRGVFDRVVTELLYSDISDITYKKQGVAASLANHGTILIRTIGDRRLLMDRVSRPELVVELINSLRLALLGDAARRPAQPESHGQLA